MSILEYLDKNNLHHAYLIEGDREKVVPEILSFCEDLGIKTSGNPDFCQIVIDNFKIDEAFDLRAMSVNKNFTSSKRVFVLGINNFSLDAQNVLLKMFEEPTLDTHFFLVVPDTNALLKTFVSRFYFISTKSGLEGDRQKAEKFITMTLQNRVDFIKEFLKESEEEEGEEAIMAQDSTRSKALKFLNVLESSLHSKFINDYSKEDVFEHIFKVRRFLRMPGSSAKNLMESVALVMPSF